MPLAYQAKEIIYPKAKSEPHRFEMSKKHADRVEHKREEDAKTER